MDTIKYQVFISSTYTDLIEERRKVLDVLLMADCIPAGMEAFVATDAEQFEVIKKVIDYCDYYVLIIGKRYGSISPDTGISYTEMEYDYAISKGIPVLVFAINESVDLPADKVDTDPDRVKKLCAFRKKALNNRMATIWSTADELTGHLAVSIMKAKADIKRPGWQRAVDYDEISLMRQIMELQSENGQLKKELSEMRQTIDSLTLTNDLSFEDCTIHFDYYYDQYGTSGYGGSKVKKSCDISLVDLFKVISLQMLDVSIPEKTIEHIVKNNLIKEDHLIYFSDSQVIKRVLNQLSALGLVFSKWDKESKNLFWGITKKGKAKRDELLLIKRDNPHPKDD